MKSQIFFSVNLALEEENFFKTINFLQKSFWCPVCEFIVSRTILIEYSKNFSVNLPLDKKNTSKRNVADYFSVFQTLKRIYCWIYGVRSSSK